MQEMRSVDILLHILCAEFTFWRINFDNFVENDTGIEI